MTVEASARIEPARRGRLSFSDRVVEKIASHAASEVAVAGGRSGGFLGLGGEVDLAARPDVSVALSGRSVTLSVRLGLEYPVSIRQATQEVREHLRSRVEALTGLSVRRVDVSVSWLTVARSDDDTAGRRKLL